MNQEAGPHRTQNLPPPGSQTSSLQNLEKSMSVVCNPRVYGILLQQHKWTKDKDAPIGHDIQRV